MSLNLPSALDRIEVPQDDYVSFRGARDLLAGSVDLESLKEETVLQHAQWGLVGYMIARGNIGNASGYGSIIDSMRFSRAGIALVREGAKQGRNILLCFNPGITIKEAYDLLIQQGGIPTTNTSAAQNLEHIVEIKPGDISCEDASNILAQRAAYRNAAKGKSSTVHPRPHAHFVHDTLTATQKDTSAFQSLQMLQEGVACIDPATDMIRFRIQLDSTIQRYLAENLLLTGSLLQLSESEYARIVRECMKLHQESGVLQAVPDAECNTVYPLSVFGERADAALRGKPLLFEYGTTYRLARFYGVEPDEHRPNLGQRLSIQ